MANQIHNTYSKKEGVWKVKKTGNTKASFVSETKKEADEKGKELARKEKAEFVSHRKDGTIGEKNSYGNDPNPPKDKDGKKIIRDIGNFPKILHL